MRIHALTLIVFLLWPGRVALAESENISSPDSRLSSIDQIWNDGTVILKDGTKLRVSREALKRSEMQANQEILVYSRNGKSCEDAKGRRVGWLLIMDPARQHVVSTLVPEEKIPVPENVVDSVLVPQAAGTFNSMAGYDLVSRATVAPPVGAGLHELEEKIGSLTSSGTVFLEDGKKVRLGKNVLRDSMGTQGRLFFCISRSKKTSSVVRDLVAAPAK